MSLPPDYVAQLHTLVDTLTAPVAATHQARIQCTRGCAGCCADGLTVFEVEADHIRRSAPAVLHGQQPHPPGACAMLDADGACRIYAARPYVCRTQGLPLRWAEADPDNAAQAIELRDICPLNADGPPSTACPTTSCGPSVPWSNGSPLHKPCTRPVTMQECRCVGCFTRRHPFAEAAVAPGFHRVAGREGESCAIKRGSRLGRSMRPRLFTVLTCALAAAGCNSNQVWFSSDSTLTDVVSSEIEGAANTLDIAVYTFTAEPIRDAIIDAHARGVKTRVAIDEWATNDAIASSLADEGVPVRRAKGYNGGIMHHKFIVVDEARVLTGSFNYTRSADEANDENLVLIANKVLAGQYTNAFSEVWSRGEDE